MIGSRVPSRVATAVVVGALALPACTGGGGAEDPSPSPTVSAETPSPTVSAETPSPSATGIDITTVPDEITEDYIQAVLDDIADAYNQALRVALELDAQPTEPQAYPPEIRDLVESRRGPRQTEAALQALALEADEDERQNLREPMTGYVYQLGDFHTEGQCVVATVSVDSTGVVRDPPSPVLDLTMILGPDEADGLPFQLLSIQDSEGESLDDLGCAP